MSTSAKFETRPQIAADKVDAERGIIRDVALISIGEAAGHSTRIDQKTLEMFYALVTGQTVKAFVNHSADPKPTEAVGIYSGFYIDVEAGALRAAQLQVFKAFRENSKSEYDTLFELAQTAPEAFGISANFFMELEEASDGGHPYARPTHVESFDLVSTPAANRALFSAVIETVSQEKIDYPTAAPTQDPVVETLSQQSPIPKSNFSMLKSIFAHFAANPKALPLIAKFAAELPDDAKPEDVIDKVELALSDEEQAALVAERDALAVEVEALKAEIAALKPEADKAAELSAKVTEQADQIAQLSKRTARFGIRPVNTGKPEVKEVKSLTRAEFSALNPVAQGEHVAAGGKITA